MIRLETPEDEVAIRHVNDEAFGQENESRLIEKLRSRGMLTISLVAIRNGEVIGHIAFSPMVVETESSNFEAISLAPMAVLPAYQSKGIGSRLVRTGLEKCRHLGQEIVFVLGHPDYYPRFGFVQARPRGVDCEFKVPDEAWMVLELREGALAGRKGTAKFQPEFKEAM